MELILPRFQLQLIALLALSTASQLASTLPWNQHTIGTDNVSATEIKRIVKRSPLLAQKKPGVKLAQKIPRVKLVPVPVRVPELPARLLRFNERLLKKLQEKKIDLKQDAFKMLKQFTKEFKKRFKKVWNGKKSRVFENIGVYTLMRYLDEFLREDTIIIINHHQVMTSYDKVIQPERAKGVKAGYKKSPICYRHDGCEGA